jgi:hypothetical protein
MFGRGRRRRRRKRRKRRRTGEAGEAGEGMEEKEWRRRNGEGMEEKEWRRRNGGEESAIFLKYYTDTQSTRAYLRAIKATKRDAQNHCVNWYAFFNNKFKFIYFGENNFSI